MAYDLFLFDLDDTLLNFSESERLSFSITLQSLNIDSNLGSLFDLYQIENRALWRLFEKGETTKEYLKVERFRKVFNQFAIDVDPEIASKRYLEALPETVVLVEYAEEICKWLSERGEIGIITNGIHTVQTQRIRNSKLAPYISFTSVSEECGYAKPDIRFFEYSTKRATKFSKPTSIVIGDRMETDILGAHQFGVDSCLFNPLKSQFSLEYKPKYEISHLPELKNIV